MTLSWRVGHPEGPARPALALSRAGLPALATGPWRAAPGGQAGGGGGGGGGAREAGEGRHVREARAEARQLAATVRTVGRTLLTM